MKQDFQITQDELNEILEASKPTPVMYLSGGTPMFDSPQENANRVWKKLADKYGFVWDSAELISNKPPTNFKATPTQIKQSVN